MFAFPIIVYGLTTKVFKIGNVFIPYLLISLILLGFLSNIYAWWAYKSNEMLMTQYGYNFDAMSDAERYKNVVADHMIKVKQLEISVMGIGWRLKAIFAFVMWMPYLFVIYFGCVFIIKLKTYLKNVA